MRSLRASLALCILLAGVLGARHAAAYQWARYAIISPTTTMSAGHLCYTDGLGIACDSSAPLASGLGLSDRITSGTSSVFVSQDSAVSVTIGGSNVANFGTGGLGITAINASGRVTAAGVSTTGPISGTTGYFSGAAGTAKSFQVGAPTQAFGGGTSHVFFIKQAAGSYFQTVLWNDDQSNTSGTRTILGFPVFNGTSGLMIESMGGSLGGFNTGGYDASIHTGQNTSYLFLSAGSGGPTTKHLTITPSGKIGIATITPTATLQVSGTFIVSTTGQNTTPSIYVSNSGYVGVGTSAPSAMLTVKGEAIADYLTLTGGTASVALSNSALSLNSYSGYPILFTTSGSEKARLSASGYLGIATATPTTALEVSGTISATHFVGDGSGLTGLSTAQGDRITSGTSSVFVAQDSAVSVTIGSSNVANFGSGGLGITAINASGLVMAAGVSTTGPISGTSIYSSGFVEAQSDIRTYGNIRLMKSGSRADIYDNGYAQPVGINGSKVLLNDLSGGNVGIGITAPAYPLDISGTLATRGTGGLGNYIAMISSGGGHEYDFYGDGPAVGALGLYDRTASAYRWVINSSGNMGIGTTAPAANLQVSGTFIVSTTGQSTTPSLYVGSTGKVGIGTTAPSTSLHVVKNDDGITLQAAGSSSYITSIINQYNAAERFYLKNGGTKILGLKSTLTGASSDVYLASWTGLAFATLTSDPTAADIRMYINQAGKIGVGTVTPTTPFEVVGTASATNVAAVSVTTAGIKLTSATTASAQCTTDADVGAIRLNGTRAEICSPYPN